MHKASVIIPVYNTESWLEECLNSVVNQTMSDLEIICVDDASTDNSGKILKQYAQKDNRIQIITLRENTGQSHARNIGMDQAKGEYIYFLDSDDYIVPEALEILYNISREYYTDIVYFDAVPIYETEELKKRNNARNFVRKEGDYEKIYLGIDLFLSFIKNDEWVVEVPRQFYSTKFLKQNHFRFQDGVLREDVWFSNECIFAAKKVKYIPDRLFIRRFRKNSTMTGKMDTKHFLGEYRAAYYTNRFAHQNGLYEVMRTYIAKLNSRTISLYELCRKEIEPEKLVDQELIESYYFFESLQDYYCAYGDLSEELLEKVSRFKYVYIYGAGTVARFVCLGLVKKQLKIDGFIVTDISHNPKVLEGHKVMELGFLSRTIIKEECIIIIAIKEDKQQIGEMLDQIHIEYVYYDD